MVRHHAVSPETITFSTYVVDDLGNATLFDKFSVVKKAASGINEVSASAGKVKIIGNNDMGTIEGMPPDSVNIYNLDGLCVYGYLNKN